MSIVEIVVEDTDVKLLKAIAEELWGGDNATLAAQFNTLLSRWSSTSFKNRYIFEQLWEGDMPIPGPWEDLNKRPARRIRK